MADNPSLALQELVRKAALEQDVDFLREGVRVLTEAIVEAERRQYLGAEPYERTGERGGQRNGHRERPWDTRVGTVELKVARARDGGCFPSRLEPRRRAERAWAVVVQEADLQGGATRRVDELVKALGMDGISQSPVSRVGEALDAEVERFRTRRLEGADPYVWLDATFVKVRREGRVVNVAVVIAVGVRMTGEREVRGLDVGPLRPRHPLPSEDGAFWLRWLRSLVFRGRAGGW